MGSMPVTGRSAPFSESSPTKANRSFRLGSWPLAHKRASSTGRSYTGPVLRSRAGARFTVMRLAGHAKPRFFAALRTRSAASFTALSGRPTMLNWGSPPLMSASAVTAKPERPCTPKLFTRANITPPP